MRTISRCLLLSALLVLRAGAATVLDDKFDDGSRTDQNLPSSAAWYYSGSTATRLAVTNSNLVWSSITSADSGVVMSFTPQTLGVGQSLTISFTMSVNGVGNVQNGFRIGVFNSGGSPISADGWLANTMTYSGFGASADLGTLTSTTSSYLWYRSTATAASLFSGTTLKPESGAGSTGADLNLTSDQFYTGSFVITNNGTSITTSFNLGDISLTMTDTTRLSYTTFDTLAFYGVKNSASSITFSEISIANSAVPEPGSVALIGAGLMTMLLLARRKRTVFRGEIL